MMELQLPLVIFCTYFLITTVIAGGFFELIFHFLITNNADFSLTFCVKVEVVESHYEDVGV